MTKKDKEIKFNKDKMLLKFIKLHNRYPNTLELAEIDRQVLQIYNEQFMN